LDNHLIAPAKPRVSVPVIALGFYAVASGYLMSLIPLMLSHYGLDTAMASWLPSSFYAGLLVGALSIEPLVTRVGYKHGFALCLATGRFSTQPPRCRQLFSRPTRADGLFIFLPTCHQHLYAHRQCKNQRPRYGWRI